MSDMNFTVSQSAAIGRLQGNTAVSAGAGSGKTRVLVERYLRLVEQGLSGGVRTGVSDIVAITFTKKAAGELRERVCRELERRATADVLHAAFWRQQLEELPKAQISTIHGYCSRLLREHPVELALAPDFQVAEEFAAEEFLQECLKKFLRLRFGSSSALKELVSQYGGQAVLRQLELLLPHVKEIAAVPDLTAPYMASIAAAQPLYGQLAELLEELLAQESELATKSNKDFFRELATALPEIAAELRERQDTAPLERLIEGRKSTGKLKDYLKEIKELRAKLTAAAVDQQALPLVRLWQELLQDFAGFLRQEKQQRDFLSFDDLETLALELLQRHPEVRRACQERVRYLMVDEFQDTNERQKQLVYLLCGDDKNELQGGKLFVVGDPKQSIYRFRGADVGVFAEVRRAVAAKDSAGVIAMYDNFRTTDAILQAVDAAFSTLMGTDAEQDVYFEPLLPHLHGEMRPMFLEVPYDKASAGGKRRLEAEAVAREIEARHARQYIYRDSEGREHTEAPSYKDMAVLLGRFTHVQTLTEALRRHNIPFVVQSGRDFYECQEVLDLLNLLQALQNKYNNIALAGALRSPYFGLDDESLTRLFLSLEKDGSLLDALLAADANLYDAGQRELLLRARAICGRLRLAASVCGLPELWQAVEAELQPDAVLARQEDGEQKLANVRKLRQLALKFAAVQNGSLGEWLAYTDRLRRQKVRETAANLPTGDAVTIMTVHASKGLEFKTVILPMLDMQGKADSDMIRFDKQLGLGIKAVLADGSLEDSSVYKAVKEREKALAAAESLRLLYVAMTRAQYDLLLSGAYNIETKKSDASSWFNLLRRAYGGSDAVEFKEVDLRGLEPDTVPATEKTPLPVPPELLAGAAPLSDFEQGLTTFSPSSLQEYLFCRRAFFYRYIARLPELELLGKALPQAAGSGEGEPALPPKLAGLLIHKALELLHWESLPPSLSKERREKAEAVWQAALAEAAPEYEGKASAGKAREMFFNYIYSGLYQSIAPEHRREQRFSLLYGGYEFSGVLDCLYRDGSGRWHIVDYKTGRPPLTQLPLGYACQMALYRQAAAEVFGAAGAVAELHFLQDNSCWPLPPEADFLQQALALCDEINAKKMAESSFACSGDRQRCDFCSYNYLCPRM